MKKLCALLVFVVLATCLLARSFVQKPDLRESSMITYGLSGSRFGDGLVCYIHAKWLSYKYGIPVLYTPFPQSEYLSLADKEVNQTVRPQESFKEIVHLTSKANIDRLKNHKAEKNILYIIPYYSEYEGECNNAFFKQFITIDWRDQEFKNLLRAHIASDHVSPKPVLLPDMVNVALHLRTGRGFDNLAKPGDDYKQAIKGAKQFCNVYFPLKLPALNFYSNALHQLCLLLKNQRVHVHIFTDDSHPEEVIESLKHEMAGKAHSCVIEYTHDTTSQNDLDIMTDFFAMTHYDCLIRPASNFSYCAAKISDFLLEISPKSLVRTDEFFFINKFHVQYRDGRAVNITISVPG